MKNKLIYGLMVFIVLFISCQEKKPPVIVKDHNETPSYVKRIDNNKITDSLFNLAINKGNMEAYDKVSSDFILVDDYQALLYYSLIMADKYNYNAAHFHVFVILSNSSSDRTFDKLDEKTKNLALYHLAKANELGYKSAQYSINEIFGKGKIIKKSSYYLMEYSK